jgi:hypothetical protein
LDLFICFVKNNAESSWVVGVASNDQALVNSDWERIFKEVDVA